MQERLNQGLQRNQSSYRNEKGAESMFNRISNFFLIRLILVSLSLLSFLNYIKSILVKDRVLINKTYGGEPILLLALYEKSYLRPDIQNLIQQAKAMNLFVVAVNTAKLKRENIEKNKSIFGVYIERFNFGRDFGSYKKGFNYIFNQGFHKLAPRILMLNDSVYYEPSRLKSFLKDLLQTKKEVLGATENNEINYHIGSFCISLSHSITTNKKFIAYWRRYQLSDVRPKVILTGEMALSKLLLKIVSNRAEIAVLFNQTALLNFITDSDKNINLILRNSRQSKLMPWPIINLNSLVYDFLSSLNYPWQVMKETFRSEEVNEKLPTFECLEDVKNYFNLTNKNFSYEKFKEFSIGQIVEHFSRGSQIHQNSTALLIIGLPLIKLDIYYRGMLVDEDLIKFRSLLKQDEFNYLSSLLRANAFGGNAYIGLKRLAFLAGLI